MVEPIAEKQIEPQHEPRKQRDTLVPVSKLAHYHGRPAQGGRAQQRLPSARASPEARLTLDETWVSWLEPGKRQGSCSPQPGAHVIYVEEVTADECLQLYQTLPSCAACEHMLIGRFKRCGLFEGWAQFGGGVSTRRVKPIPGFRCWLKMQANNMQIT